jgi:hypothetical protein
MNFFQTSARAIIKKSFHLSVWLIECFHDMSVCQKKTEQLGKLPEGTIGREIAECLKTNSMRLVPGYESHDLKHVLLGFKMTPVDEIRMQAFMLGNGNISIPSLAIFAFGAFLLPELWPRFYKDYRDGLATEPIKSWMIEDYANRKTAHLRQIVFNRPKQRQTRFSLKSLTQTGAWVAITLGAFGMMFCLPFLFSSNITDLVGAGFPFIGGAIIASTGLITLASIAKQTDQVNALTVTGSVTGVNVVLTQVQGEVRATIKP